MKTNSKITSALRLAVILLMALGLLMPFATSVPVMATVTYTVTASAGAGGTISPAGVTTVNYGDSVALNITPDAGYHISSITDNGTPVGITDPYEINNISANHTVVATFAINANNMPTVTTTTPTGITSTSAVVGGNVISEGGFSVTTRGICWSTSVNPTISSSHTNNGTGTGSYTSTITGLSPQTLYHVRAYATNSFGTSYGSDISFQTIPTWRQGIQKGDILLMREKNKYSDGGLFYTHAGIYVGDGKVAEAMRGYYGAELQDITNWDSPTRKYVTRLRLKEGSLTKGSQAADWAIAQTKRTNPHPEFDSSWTYRDDSIDSKKWYCAELVWASYHHYGVDLACIGEYGPSSSWGAVSPDHICNDDEVEIVGSHTEYNPPYEPSIGAMITWLWCPVSLSITDPDGLTINLQDNEIEGATYLYYDKNDDGELESVVVLPERKLGNYGVSVIPDEGALPGDTYSLNLTSNAGDISLATDVKVEDIPEGGYLLKSSEADLSIISEQSTWYLAEGSTDWGFDCYVSIENPNATAVNVKLTYMTSTGKQDGPTVKMPAKSQATVFPSATLGAADFSTKVECTEGKLISVDRTMYWTGPTSSVGEAHCATGVTASAGTWYMPEGSSNWGFECFVLIQNPNDTAAEATVTWMIEGEAPQTTAVTVPASSRSTVNMAEKIGAKDASIKVDSATPVICERAMYRNDRREGHDSGGTPTAAADYYLAEGCTGFGFTTYILVQNPQNSETKVTVNYQAASGPVTGPAFTMPANSRKTICVNTETPIPGDDPSFSTHVHGSKPIIAERAMYWNGGDDGAQVCHDSIGLDRPYTNWYLADGQSSEGRETWTLVQNPNDTAVTVQITYMTPDGTGNVVKTETIAANSRRSFNMAEHSGINGRAAIMVRCTTSGKKVMCERAMYWNNRGTGTDTIGGYAD
jgi:uncharacterized protein YycO